MGLFEKQIPKYVRTLDGNIAVQPTRVDASLVPDLRVDDIFDPLFNANVRERLRQDYGNLATFAGYNELLNNIWVENDGTFGKGMGLLSAFGRSMEKADDLILGAATEGVKGLTGQGFENPLENIFVNDEDYTGRRFLAAAANAMSGFADGTTVTEDDFGAAWTLPSLGIELGTDVGILGSGLSRALTPHFSEAAAAGKRVSSGEILKNLGKSGNAATTIGEVGQLLSDYDDLMTRVAIDVTAPGLRPAFKKLLGKIAGMIGPASYYNYEDYIMGDAYPSNKFGPDVPNDPSRDVEGLTTLYKNAKAAMDSIPETADEVIERQGRSLDQISEEVIANAEAHAVERELALRAEIEEAMAEDIARGEYNGTFSGARGDVDDLADAFEQSASEAVHGAEAPEAPPTAADIWNVRNAIGRNLGKGRTITDAFIRRTNKPYKKVTSARTEFQTGKMEAFTEMLNRAAEKGHPIDIGAEGFENYADPDVQKVVRLIDDYDNSRGAWYTSGMAEPLLKTDPETGATTTYRLHRKQARLPLESLKPYLKRIRKKLLDARSTSVASVSPALSGVGFKVNGKELDAKWNEGDWREFARIIYDSEYDFQSPKSFLEGFESQRSTPFYRKSSHRWHVSPSELALMNSDDMRLAMSAAHSQLDALRFTIDPKGMRSAEGSALKPIFKDEKEFDAYFNTDHMTTVLHNLFNLKGERDVLARPMGSYEDMQKAEQNISRFKKLLKNALFPKEPARFFSDLTDLVEFVDNHSITELPEEVYAKLYKAAPEEVAYIGYVDSMLDNIGTEFVSRVKGWGAYSGSKEAMKFLPAERAARASFRYPDPDTEFMRDDFSDTADAYIKHALAKLGQTDIPYEDLEHIVEPLKPYMQFKVNHGADLSGTKYAMWARFFTQDGIPFVEDLMRHGGNPFVNYRPKEISKEKFDAFRAALGLGTPIDEISDQQYANRKMLEYLLGNRTNSYALANTSEPLTIDALRKQNFPLTPQPKRPVPVTTYHGEVEAMNLGTDTANAFKVATPSEFEHMFQDLHDTLNDRVLKAMYIEGTSGFPGWEMFADTSISEAKYELQRAIANTGFDEKRIQELLDDFKDPKLRAKMSDQEIRAVHYYTQVFNDVLGNIPYHIIKSDAHILQQEPRLFLEGFISEALQNHTLKLSKHERDRLYALLEAHYSDNLEGVLSPRVYSKNLSLVKRVVDAMPPQLQKAWKPSATRGLFYFDVTPAQTPYVIRLGETLPFFSYDSQIYERYGMTAAQALTSPNPTKYGKYMGYLDYRKMFDTDLQGVSFAESLAEVAANAAFRMDLQKGSAFTRVPAEAVFNDLRKKHLLKKAERVKTAPKVATQLPEPVVETSQAVDEIVTRTVEQPTAAIVEQITVPEAASTAAARAEDVINKICPEVSAAIEAGLTNAQIKIAYPKQWRLFKQISDAKSVAPRNATGDYATARAEQSVRVERKMLDFVKSRANRNLDFKQYYQLKARQAGDILPGTSFWNELAESGMLTTCLPKGSRKITQLEYALRRNADVINDILDGDYVEVIVHNTVHADEAVRKAILANAQKVDRETVNVTLRFKQGAYDVVSKIKKHLKELDEATFEDIVFAEPEKLTAENLAYLQQFQEFERIEREGNLVTQDFYKMLGFKFDNADTYSRHAMNFNDNTMLFLQSNFYGQMPSEELDDIVDNIATVRNTRGAFGTRLSSRRFRGHYWNLEYFAPELFSYSPIRRFNSQITGGALANNQFQTYVDLFHNGNFAIDEYFKTPEDLKKVLYAAGPSGKSGNFNNLELVTFKVNSDGRVVGLHRFDKSTDKGLQQALDTPGTILVPTSVIAHIDKMFKTEKRMSNKFWVFTNKYFTTPFKLGVLMNPGFLVGNLSDASMKTVTAMAQKYGTTVTKEAENFADSLTACVNLKNTFYSVFEEFLTATKNADFQLNPSETIPDIAAMSPKHRKSLQAWLTNTLTHPVETTLPDGSTQIIDQVIPCDIDPEIISQASFWMNLQTLQMNTSKTREMAELAGVVKKSKYAPKAEGIARIIEILVDNPATKAVMGASEWTESTVRTAMLYNDFKHRGFAPGQKASNVDFYTLDTAAVDALNTTYSAHFDYENVPDFMDAISNAVPFPIFFLKNFYFWMNLFMENPQFVDNVIDVQEGLWEHRKKKDENNEFAKGAKGRGAVPVGDGDLTGWFKGFYKPSPLQSMFGAFSLLNDPVNDLQYRLHPAISGAASAVHYAAPSDLTTLLNPDENLKYRPYSTNPYERNLSPSDPNYNPLAFAVHRANPLERATNTFLRTPSKVASGDAQLSDFLPSIFQPEF
jgi:hypothetical protein